MIIKKKNGERSVSMPLTMVPIGEERVVLSFRGNDEVKRRLQDLGFHQGQGIKILSENDSGLILLIKDVRIALNRGLAQRIIVE